MVFLFFWVLGKTTRIVVHYGPNEQTQLRKHRAWRNGALKENPKRVPNQAGGSLPAGYSLSCS
jgi:hypothetical protein